MIGFNSKKKPNGKEGRLRGGKGEREREREGCVTQGRREAIVTDSTQLPYILIKNARRRRKKGILFSTRRWNCASFCNPTAEREWGR